MIDFTKYLQCPDCRLSGLYCVKHRAEVEKKLFIIKGINEKVDPQNDGITN